MWKKEYKYLLWMAGIFLIVYFLPIELARFTNAVQESLHLLKWYARKHVLLCLLPAFFIAGIISVFVSKASVIKYFGAEAKKWLAYTVASISGSILAVCSCTILPLFSGIYKRGAGLGPAITFLYAGPAINIMAIILTARILGPELGIARVVGAVIFSIIIGITMQLLFKKEDAKRTGAALMIPENIEERPLYKTIIQFSALVAILIFANWGSTGQTGGLWQAIYSIKWYITAGFGLVLAYTLSEFFHIDRKQVAAGIVLTVAAAFLFPASPALAFFTGIVSLSILISGKPDGPGEWMEASWNFAKQILPVLAAGVLVSGFLLGSPEGGQGMIPEQWIASMVGGNSLFANFFASIVGAFMYFATLTEVVILQGLIENGMGKGPALALLLAGPALSLPNMLVIRSVLGWKKTIVFVGLVIIMATISGLVYGLFF